MRLFSQYRLFLLTALATVYYLSSSQTILGQRDALLFEVAHLGYLVAALAFIYLQRKGWPSVQTRSYLQNYLDIVFICLLMYASGGVQSGFGALLVITVALLSQLNTVRYSLFFAALASVIVLLEELLAQVVLGAYAANFERTALLGAMLLIVAWISTVPLRNQLMRQIPASSPDRAKLDVKQIAMLNEEIIRELDSGVLVIDSAYRVQLMNDTARAMLSCEFSPLPIHVGRLNEPLFESMQSAKRGNSLSATPFAVAGTGESLLPRYIPLSSGGMLIKLDDHAHIKKQFQQLKLASLGRLSASIAHEIRNPLGAIAHAVQLLQESEELSNQDAKLLNIAYRHTNRIDRIVEDVLQLSHSKRVNSESLDLVQQLHTFTQRFIEEHDLSSDSLSCITEPNLHVMFDAEHLDQILWNLCTNARLHNAEKEIKISISAWKSQQGLTVMDITDNGNGIPDIHREQLFEPFYSTHHDGSGLGLYIIRELCDMNKARIECLERQDGAHFRITLSSAQQMAA